MAIEGSDRGKGRGESVWVCRESRGECVGDCLGLVLDATNIVDKTSCSKCCLGCDSSGTLKIRDHGTSGSQVKAMAYGRTLTSRCKDEGKCGADCCAATWFWYDCYGKQCLEIAGSEYNRNIPPQAPGLETGGPNGGMSSLKLQIHRQKVCSARRERGTVILLLRLQMA